MKKEREWMKKVNGRPSVRAIQYPLLTGLRCTCAAKLILLRRTKRTEIGGGNPGQRMRVYRYKRAIRKRRTVFPSISGLRFFHFHFSLLHQRSIVKALFCLHYYYYYTFLGPLLLARLFKRNTELRSVSKEEEENYFDREKSPRMV